MKIIGIGIDVCEFEHIEKKVNNTFAKEILGGNEYAKFLSLTSQKAKMTFFASRLAAKNALFKALSLKRGKNAEFDAYELNNDEYGRPFFESKKLDDALKINLSIANASTFSTAYIIITQE